MFEACLGLICLLLALPVIGLALLASAANGPWSLAANVAVMVAAAIWQVWRLGRR